MTYLHRTDPDPDTETRTFRFPNPMAILYYAEILTLHGVRLRFQSSLIANYRNGIRVRVRQCN